MDERCSISLSVLPTTCRYYKIQCIGVVKTVFISPDLKIQEIHVRIYYTIKAWIILRSFYGDIIVCVLLLCVCSATEFLLREVFNRLHFKPEHNVVCLFLLWY